MGISPYQLYRDQLRHQAVADAAVAFRIRSYNQTVHWWCLDNNEKTKFIRKKH